MQAYDIRRMVGCTLWGLPLLELAPDHAAAFPTVLQAVAVELQLQLTTWKQSAMSNCTRQTAWSCKTYIRRTWLADPNAVTARRLSKHVNSPVLVLVLVLGGVAPARGPWPRPADLEGERATGSSPDLKLP
ncbi:hypothetical protein B0T25DRAFT_97677 [Lasiosphaeria hispida]|uniref:Uncharacterized protein n=1 Tax=Lasiosphaeria hispida TaxID=260671 RepID=A0AAJ0MHS4_9PEZI|nr:hypothetical protein B0T25DRAFT_97677 [Lasiosphaeria hispida]